MSLLTHYFFSYRVNRHIHRDTHKRTGEYAIVTVENKMTDHSWRDQSETNQK